jgi:signal transduction histidine kinase
MFDKYLPYWLTRGMLRAGAVMSGILFVISYIVDISLVQVGVSPAATVLNDAAIALIAASVLIFYLFSSRTEQIFLRARERMNLTAELNHHLRQVLTEMRNAAEVEDRDERLQMMDEAIEKADHVLIDLVPTVNAERAPRLTPLQHR